MGHEDKVDALDLAEAPDQVGVDTWDEVKWCDAHKINDVSNLNMKQLQWFFLLNSIATCEYEIHNNPRKVYKTCRAKPRGRFSGNWPPRLQQLGGHRFHRISRFSFKQALLFEQRSSPQTFCAAPDCSENDSPLECFAWFASLRGPAAQVTDTGGADFSAMVVSSTRPFGYPTTDLQTSWRSIVWSDMLVPSEVFPQTVW